MARKKKGNKIDGWLNINKPYDVTSTDVVRILKRILKPQKIGHAGTLDPLATGILPIALGEATKTIPFIQDAEKIYGFTTRWGEQRSTDDLEGDVIAESDARPSRADIEALLPQFIGTITQTPPKFSAIKINGERAYDLARDGEEFEVPSREVEIYDLKIISHSDDETAFEVCCGKGTYVRAIARDIGAALGCYGYVSALNRKKVGCFGLEDAFLLDISPEMDNSAALEEAILPLHYALDDIPAVNVNDQEASRLKQGQSLSLISKPDIQRLTACGLDVMSSDIQDAVAMYQGKALALLEVDRVNLKPYRVFNM
ncbi:MAG: tRNA pseudouridine(55) synthase TruB [Alphaproteobacteria bacterium]|nr:tRNA pseudouridine(55) synthase TruB [Alphaproteobacteria bacterium]